MKKAIHHIHRAAMLTALAMGTMATTATTLKGRVYVDANTNGQYDSGERTLAGVAVSDGLNVVRTASDGSFTLPGHAKERFVFITTPSGYTANGTFYRRINTATHTYDFGLKPLHGTIASDGSHSFIHISDTEIHGEISNDENQDWVQNLRDYAATAHVAFIMHTGDICYDNGLRNHIRLMNTDNMGVPVFYSIGNHDLVKGDYGEQLYEQLYGPVCYSFDVGSTHYVVTPMAGGDYRPSYTDADVYQWVRNDLAMVPKGKPVIFFNHDLPVTTDQFAIKGRGMEPLNLDDYNLKAWLYGHWHMNHIHRHAKATSICSITPVRGGIDHSLGSFRVMHINKNGDFISELRYPYINKSVSIASVSHFTAPTTGNKVHIAVNAYTAVAAVRQVTATCLAPDGTTAGSIKLRQQTDFAWSGDMPLATTLDGLQLAITARVEFVNGEMAETSAPFIFRSNDTADACKPRADWTNYLGNAAHNNARVESDTLHCPRIAWVNNVGSNIYMTAPIKYGDAVYTASVDENGQGRAAIVCLDAKTGRIIWRHKTQNSVKNTIVATNGLVFAQDADGILYAIDARSGKLKWNKRLSIAPVLPSLIEGIVADNGIVYAGSGHGLCAVEATTGKTLWTNNGWQQNQGSTATFSVGGGVLVGSAHWSALYGNDLDTGKCLWSLECDGIRHRSSSAVIDNGIMWLASGESIFAIEARTGHIITRHKLPFSVNVASTPLVTDSDIILGTATEGMVALDRETMSEKWRFRPEKAMVYTAPYSRSPAATIEAAPVLNGNNVVVGASDGTLYMLDRKTGKVAWRHNTGAPILAPVTLSGNMMYAVDYSGNVYGFADYGTIN